MPNIMGAIKMLPTVKIRKPKKEFWEQVILGMVSQYPCHYDPDKVGTLSGINISNRPDDVWELKEIREVTVKEGDTLSTIITQYSINHFRMNRG